MAEGRGGGGEPGAASGGKGPTQLGCVSCTPGPAVRGCEDTVAAVSAGPTIHLGKVKGVTEGKKDGGGTCLTEIPARCVKSRECGTHGSSVSGRR